MRRKLATLRMRTRRALRRWRMVLRRRRRVVFRRVRRWARAWGEPVAELVQFAQPLVAACLAAGVAAVGGVAAGPSSALPRIEARSTIAGDFANNSRVPDPPARQYSVVLPTGRAITTTGTAGEPTFIRIGDWQRT